MKDKLMCLIFTLMCLGAIFGCSAVNKSNDNVNDSLAVDSCIVDSINIFTDSL